MSDKQPPQKSTIVNPIAPESLRVECEKCGGHGRDHRNNACVACKGTGHRFPRKIDL